MRLVGARVELEPLGPEHADGLLAAADADEVFEWLRWTRPRRIGDAEAWIAEALAEGRRVPFAVRALDTGAVVGSSSYWDFDPDNSRLEIGSTWFGRSSWRTGRNAETKLLLLEHAFEALGLERVAFQTDWLNERSRAAIERLGATHEGVHRHDRRRLDGSWRDSTYYSILSAEWPAAKPRILAGLNRPR